MKGKINLVHRLSLAVILFGGQIFDYDNDPLEDLKKSFSKKSKEADPYLRGYDHGFPVGDQQGVLDALQNNIRPLYQPKPVPSCFPELRDYTQGFADGHNDAYDSSLTTTLRKKTKPFWDDSNTDYSGYGAGNYYGGGSGDSSSGYPPPEHM